MIFAIITTGGKGKRMGAEVPKQFLEIKGVPIIIRTIEAFVSANAIDGIVVTIPTEYVETMKKLIEKYFPENREIFVTAGGSDRNKSLMKAVDMIEEKGWLDEETFVVTHDGVRPFVNSKMIEENINAALKYGAAGTYVPVTDTVIVSSDGKTVDSVKDRSKIFLAQTPQTFRAYDLKNLYMSLSEEEKVHMTDAVGIFVACGEKVHMTAGDRDNIKITYPEDIYKAGQLLEKDKKSDSINGGKNE